MKDGSYYQGEFLDDEITGSGRLSYVISYILIFFTF